jgi:23S rRNA (cytosine1962-C5)-methyltransferase
MTPSLFFEPPYPVVRLSPKAEARALRHGFPWVYSGELVMDRRTSALLPGAFAVLEDSERRPMGVVTVNPNSKIVARVMELNPTAVIDEGWIAARLARALSHREALFPEPFYRLVHAEADGLAGVIVDRLGDLAVVQPNAAWSEAMIGPLVAAFRQVTGVSHVVKNGSGRARGLEGLPEEIVMAAGEAPTGPIPVPMNGAVYLADVLGGQKTGLFYDQRPNHAFAARLAPGGRMLDVFSHVGGFGLAALAGGAAEAVCVDASAAALRWPRAARRRWGWASGSRRGRGTPSRCWRRWGGRASASTSWSATRRPLRRRRTRSRRGCGPMSGSRSLRRRW